MKPKKKIERKERGGSSRAAHGSARLLEAAKGADWMQVVGNGGPPCFHIEGERFCLRAERWDGHKTIVGSGAIHEYVSLERLLRSIAPNEKAEALCPAKGQKTCARKTQPKPAKSANPKARAGLSSSALLGQSVNEWPRAALLALPHRKWDDESPRYESLLIVSTGKKHDSGWAMMAIIGCLKQKPVEICTSCSDDIEWKMPAATKFGGGKYTLGQYRSDMAIKSGALHVWTREGQFRVGASLSSTEIELCPNDQAQARRTGGVRTT